MNRRTLVYGLLAAALLAGFFYTQFRIRPDARPLGKAEQILQLAQRNDLNVVFVLIDTLRADRLGAYGYERPTSPTLDQLASTGIRFSNHLTQSSWTKTSMASIWTSMYPNRTGILRFDHAIPDSAVLPAEILKDAGFLTAGIWRNGWVAPTFGFEQGFEIYHRPEIGAPIDSVRRESKNPYAKLAGSDIDATDGAIEFMRANKSDRFFLYLHFMDAHQYLSDEESAIFGTSYSDLYDNSIHWSDRQIAVLLAALEQQGLRDKTLVVVASDHGEAFQEHGNEGHAKDLHREVVYTPWIIGLPFSLERGIVIDAMTENVDIWPTILDLLGESAPEGVDGRSRLPEILAVAGVEGDGQPVGPPRPSYAQLDRTWGKADAEPEPVIAVTVDGQRFMRGLGKKSGVKLFDIVSDPREEKNLLVEGPPVDIQKLDALIDAYQAMPEPAWRKDVESVELDDMQKGQLRAIGYSIE
jgi:arylsulfatase A-like enzyme